jgi:ParB family chromosome partitioning protein
MATTQSRLENLETNLDESIGVRQKATGPKLSPVPSSKDVGRRPLRNAARIAIEQVIPDPAQPRAEFAQDSMDRLAKSILAKGQLAPIRVRWSAKHDKWIIVCGERRWRAVRAAGLETIDCCFVDGELSEPEILEQQMVENLLREDLSPIEQARGFSALMELHGWNGKQVAESLHVPASTVSRGLSLLDLPDDIQRKVDAGELAARSAYEISKLPNDPRRRELAKTAAEGKLTHKQAAAVVRQRRGKPSRIPRTTKQVFFADDGWRVTVSANKKGTYHEMENALSQALDEVRHYIEQGRTVF